MRTPYFVATERKEDTPKKKDRDLDKILKDSDEKARRLFERQDSNRRDARKEEEKQNE
jgi:hypothetical protein